MFNKLFIGLVIVTFMAVQFVFVSKSIENIVEEKWKTEVENYSDGLLERLIENENRLIKNIEKSDFFLKKSRDNFDSIETLVSQSQKTLNIVKIDSGNVKISSETHHKILNPAGCEANRGINKQYVKFKGIFEKPPTVLLSFSLLDFGHGEDHRIKSEIFNVTNNGFEIDLLTWCDTTMSQASINWVAIGW